MSVSSSSKTPYEIIEQEKEAYLEELPEPDPNWPPDVRAIQTDIHKHLFDLGLRVEDVLRRCGYHNNNTSTRFRHFIGRGPKEYILHHRYLIAKTLLRIKDISVSDVSLAVGFGNPSTFTRAFKRKSGQTPSQYLHQ